MFSTTPSGLAPASNRIRCRRPCLVTVTSTEKPCSASSCSGASPPSMVAAAHRCADTTGGRCAGPWSGMKTSVTLSINVVTTTESTGSRSKTAGGSTSCSTWWPWPW